MGRTEFSDQVRLYDGSDVKLFVLVGWDPSFFVCCLSHRVNW